MLVVKSMIVLLDVLNVQLLSKTKCSSCVAYRGTLYKAYHRWTDKLNSSPDRCTAPSSHVNFPFLSTPQKQTRYTRLRSKLHAVEKNLKDAIARQTLHQGVHLDEQVRTDFISIYLK